jgi:hypothetical protein
MQFPDATINALSNGYEKKSRMVIVSWKIAPLPLATPSKPISLEASYFNFAAAGVTVIGIPVVLVASIVLALRTRRKKSATLDVPNEAPTMSQTEQTETKPELKIEWIEMTWKENTCYVRMTFENDLWTTPFLTQKAPINSIFRKSFKDAVRAIKQCMANPIYQSAIEQLIAEGTIKVQEGVPS